MLITEKIDVVLDLLHDGAVVAYPTEAVYGLGCDAFNAHAVQRILTLKQRDIKHGLIVLISKWEHLFPLIDNISDAVLDSVHSTWPGPVTWVFPQSFTVPYWLTGDNHSIAIRMTAHPIARALCAHGPIVSTSANISGQPPAQDLNSLQQQFPCGLDAILTGALGTQLQPSAIYNVLNMEKLR